MDAGMMSIFTFSSGAAVQLKPVPPLVIHAILSDTTGKPSIPVVETTIRGTKVREENPHDPTYLARLAEWERERNARVIRVCVLKGVADEPDEATRARIRDEYGITNVYDAKYIWLSEMLLTEDEVSRFTEAVLSQTVVTQAGLAEAAQSFRRDGGRD